MEKKTAVYICTGCGIGEALDIDALGEVATGEYKAPICKNHPILCGPEGVELIKSDVASEGVNTVVIAACSPRVNYDTFDVGAAILDRVNLREQVVWCTEPNPELDDENEDIQMMAEDYLRMGMAKVGKMLPPEGYPGPDGADTQFSKDLLVVGGGVAGMTAALEAVEAGRRVTLVEKEAALGGWGAKWKLNTPTKPPYQALEDTGVAEMIAKVEGSDSITVHTSAGIEKIEGGPGLFDTTIQSNGGSATARFGAVVLATGWQPYDPGNLGHLGYGGSPDVITNVQLEEMAKAGKIARPSDGAEPGSVAFIQCAGSRDQDHLPYCSAVCCRASLKHSLYLKEQNPDTSIHVIYKDIRSPGQDEELYRQAQNAGVVFIRCPEPGVSTDGGKITVTGVNEVTGEPVEVGDLGLLVLATGMVPATAFGEDVKAKEETPEDQKKSDALPVPVDVIRASDCLNLEYRQGPELPDLKYGFPDSHFICFPYESRRTGIYPAGCVRRPMTMGTAREDAGGAVMKAIQAMEAAAAGKAVHPRSGDLSFPEFYMQRCTQCRRCTDECPFGALNEDAEGNPVPMPTRCRRCGVCMGACPERIISFKNYSVDMIGSMVKDIEVPEEDEEKPRVLILACENDAYPALDMVGAKGKKYSPYVRIVPLRCLGGINLVWIADALSKGYDGIILFGCRHGDDYQCHFIKGSELANIRMSKISETLTRLALEPERIRVEEISITDWERVPDIINEFMEMIDDIGPNPFKDL